MDTTIMEDESKSQFFGQEQPPSSQPQAFEEEFTTEMHVQKALAIPKFQKPLFELLVPIFEKRKVAVLLTDDDGKAVLNDEGNALYIEKETDIKVGFTKKIYEIPIPEVFTSSLTTAFLQPEEGDFVWEAIDNYFSKYIYSMKTGKNMTMHLYHVLAMVEATANVSKARNGETAKLLKSNYSHADTVHYAYSGELGQRQKKKSLWDSVFGQKKQPHQQMQGRPPY